MEGQLSATFSPSSSPPALGVAPQARRLGASPAPMAPPPLSLSFVLRSLSSRSLEPSLAAARLLQPPPPPAEHPHRSASIHWSLAALSRQEHRCLPACLPPSQPTNQPALPSPSPCDPWPWGAFIITHTPLRHPSLPSTPNPPPPPLHSPFSLFLAPPTPLLLLLLLFCSSFRCTQLDTGS